MNYLLDTDILIYWLNGSQAIEQRAITIELANLGFSIVTKAELYFGAYNSHYSKRNLANIDRLSQKLPVIPFDDAAARQFGQLKTTLRQHGNIILDADLMIAATALANGLILVTNNLKHFERIPNLTLENWYQP